MDGPWVGYQLPVRKVSWLKRDTLLFNISIGCKADELHFLYERHPNFSTFPTFPLGLVFKLDNQEVTDFYAAQGAVKIPGVPELDPVRLVDGDRTIEMLKLLPVTSEGRQFEFRSQIVGVFDKGKAGTVVRTEHLLVDAASDEVYTRNVGSEFYVGQGNWGGPRGPPAQRYPPPEAKTADLSFQVHIDAQSSHLYRLNGDYNPLHATPEPGTQMGYGGLINHGVFAYNVIAHEFVRRLGKSDPLSLRQLSARFSGPVKPGNDIDIEVWNIGRNSEGWDQIRWFAKVVGSDRPCLSDGTALVKPQYETGKL
ncbi:unnamed protein product [Clonostachys byssicola]|uniref:MaoC-like domain-containing protein n=1 Tax=Clonostachys byssicola TaxID=160290 RepID=A0A9N9UHQ9_9HYPO|nr:unnamed protein product [Clonostachys byssicola]